MDQVAREFHLDPAAHRRLEEVRFQVVGGHALVLDERVAERLHLTDGQRAEVRRIRERNTSAFRALETELKGARFASIEALEKQKDPTRLKTGEALLAVLTPEQRRAFRRLQGTAFPPLAGAGAGRGLTSPPHRPDPSGRSARRIRNTPRPLVAATRKSPIQASSRTATYAGPTFV